MVGSDERTRPPLLYGSKIICETVLLADFPAEAIVKTAKAKACNPIVLASRPPRLEGHARGAVPILISRQRGHMINHGRQGAVANSIRRARAGALVNPMARHALRIGGDHRGGNLRLDRRRRCARRYAGTSGICS